MSTPGAVSSEPTVTQPILLDASAADSNDEPGKSCTPYNFEGIGDNAAVPEFSGITSPGWLGLIDADNGGTGNFAHEPSPNTIAFWLGTPANSRDILFDVPVSLVSFSYASAVTVTMQAFDANNQQVASASGGGNFNQGGGGDPTGDYNRWDPLRVQTDKNIITRVRVSGNVNQTGIDDLKVCRSTLVYAVEFTQAIQEWQKLDELKAQLDAENEPPVPIIAGKPMAMRVYMEEVQSTFDLQVSVSGAYSKTEATKLQINCKPEDARKQLCPSIDFYFTPPSGEWTITLKIADKKGNEVQSEDFTIESRDSDPLVLNAVSVCDTKVGQTWQCGSAKTLASLIGFLWQVAPTHNVSVNITSDQVTLDVASYDKDHNGLSSTEIQSWWSDALDEIDGLHWFGYYFGMVYQNGPGAYVGLAQLGGSNGLSVEQSISLGQNDTQETVAHEVGHMLGRHHTNTDKPRVTVKPGCYDLAAASSGADWPYPDNRIQSDKQLEVGFDVASRTAILPDNTFELMGYCVPQWIAPRSYRGLLNTLEDGFGPFSTSSLEAPHAVGEFWRISGKIDGGTAQFNPLLRLAIDGPSAPGTGTYRIEVRNAAATAIFTRNFTPTEESESSNGILRFSEFIPVQPGAARIVLLDPSSVELGAINLDGAAPVVTITAPTGGENLTGSYAISWTVSDVDSASHTSWVQYSPDNGTTWQTIGTNLDENSLTVDFSLLPGSNPSSLIRVLTSDGVNTGTATSNAFTVPRKNITAEIIAPGTSEIFGSGDLVWLQAIAIDPEDTNIPDSKMTWISSRDGFLGTGDDLPLTTLSDGAHTITFSARDSDNNVATDSVNIIVDGAAPDLSLYVILDGTPASCADVTIDAIDQGAGLESVEYSLNGGDTWNNVPLENLPYNFVVPGAGFFHIVARTYDKAGNFDTADQPFFTQTGCQTFNATPSLIGPANAFVTSNQQPAFSWNTVPGAVRYRMKLGSSNPPLVFVFDDSTTAYIPPGPLQTRTYYWQVQAINSIGQISNWSEARSFTVQSSGRAAPGLNLSVTSTPTLSWNQISWAAGYHIQVDNNRNFSSPEFEDDTLLATDFSVTTTDLTLGSYYWHVRAKRSDGHWGDWSPIQVVVIGLP